MADSIMRYEGTVQNNELMLEIIVLLIKFITKYMYNSLVETQNCNLR